MESSFFLFTAGLVLRLLLKSVQLAMVLADIEVNTQREKPYDDLLDQIDFALRAGVSPLTVVTEIDGIRPVSGSTGRDPMSASAGRGVIFLGESALPAGSTVGLFRALLVRKDLLYEWIENGTISKEVWQEFWKYYSVEFSDDESDIPWMAIPVGDAGNKGPTDNTWWVQGRLTEERLQEALSSLNAKVLVDWRRVAMGTKGKLHFFNAHIFNEPSPGGEISINGELLREEDENISHLAGSGCSFENALGSNNDDDENSKIIRYCGAVFEAKTKKEVQGGDSLLWCYGSTYERNYPAAQVCLKDMRKETL